ncbi:Serine/threonine-protein [Carex littledalei]|uniref:Serine/threonine-protein n=1 Tax=Carex littledalei TaxID=544730 RepID=A0A833RCM8_9POAL|nr:Serine/threonine-protein [Carex littledalei]
MALVFMEVDRAAQFVLMLDGLKPEQRKKVSDLGFGCLFKLHPILISRVLIATLSKVYQSDVQTFRLGEKNVALTPWDAYCIIGLRDEGIHIDMFKREAPNEDLSNQLENPNTHNISFRDLKSRILKLGTTDENFVRCFVLLMIAGLLAQPVDDRIPWEYVSIVENVDLVSKYNWAEFTVSFLHRSIRRNKSTKMRLEGNFILLQIINSNSKMDHNNVGKDFEVKQISKELWTSTLSNKMPTKTPEKMTENKKRQVIMVYDDYEDQSEKPIPKKTKESRLREQERHTYGFIQPKYGMKLAFDIHDIGLTKDEMAAVQYVRNIDPTAEIVIMNCEIGRLTLTGDDMNCLIRPTNETGPFKWINDKVFFPINLHNQHWYVGVLNLGLKQFQILDSKAKHSSLYTEWTLNLRNGIQFLISLALDTDKALRTKYLHLNITDWPVKLIEAPQQQDNHSCGLFTLKFIELWEGDDKSNSAMEVQADLFRKQLVYQLIFSEKNVLTNVQDDIRKMVQT